MAWAEKLDSGLWRGRYRNKRGQKLRTPETYSSEARAKREAGALENDSRKPGWRDPKLGELTWAEWRIEWERLREIEGSTKQNERSMIDLWIAPYWNDWALSEITSRDVQAWLKQLRETNIAVTKEGKPNEEEPRYLATSTVKRYLTPFVSSLSAAMDAGMIPANPAYRMKLPPSVEPDRVFLTKEEYGALVDAIPNESDKAICDFLVTTGVRFGELAGLHVNRLDVTNGVVRIQEVWDGANIKPYPKGRRGRNVPLTGESLTYWNQPTSVRCGLPHREGKCRSGLAFPPRRGKVLDDRNFTRDVLKPALKAAELDDLGFTLHDFRHTYASWLAQDGIPLGRIADLLGHASTSTTEIYAHFQPSKSKDVESALNLGRTPSAGADLGQTSETPRFTKLRAVGESA